MSYEKSKNSSSSKSIGITEHQAESVRSELNTIKESGKTLSADSVKYEDAARTSQASTDLRTSESLHRQQSAQLSESESLSELSSYTKQSSAQINANHNQKVAEYIMDTRSSERAEKIFAGKDPEGFKQAATDYINQRSFHDDIVSGYQKYKAGIDPGERHKTDVANIESLSDNIPRQYNVQTQKYDDEFNKQGSRFNQAEHDTLKLSVEQNLQAADKQLSDVKAQREQKRDEMNREVEGNTAKKPKSSKTKKCSFREKWRRGLWM